MTIASGPYAAPPPPRRPPGDAQWSAPAPVQAPAPVPAPVPAPGASGGDSPWSTATSGTSGASGGDSPWGAARGRAGERVTSRVRKVVEGLPDWEPLPPGEIVVRRPGGPA